MSKRRLKQLWPQEFDCDPVYFQYQDAYHEQLLDRRIEAVHPHAWGILDINQDLNALAAGIVRFDRLRAVLFGGVFVDIEGPDGDVLPQRALEEAHLRAPRVEVFLTLPEVDDALPNVDRVMELQEPRSADEGSPGATTRLVPTSQAAERPRVTRFATRMEPGVSDLAGGHFRLDIPVLRYNLRLAFGDEPRDRVESMKVAELVRTSSGALAPNPTFAPPLLRIGAARHLHASIQHLFARMVAKQQALSLARRQRADGVVAFQAADAARFWLLHTINTFLPSIKELANTPNAHPARAKEKLAELVGALCSFSTQVDPATIPDYNHLLPGPILDWLVRAALILLDQAIAERYVEIPLERRRADLYVGAFPNAALIHHTIYLAVSGGGHTLQRFWEHVPRVSKVSSEAGVETLISTAKFGAPLEPVQTPPGALPVKDGVAFFVVRKDNDDWNKMVNTNSIGILVPIPNTDVALYAVDPQTLS